MNSQACLTAAQIILFNTKKDQPKAKSRHSLDREPPLPVYLGLNVHSLTRSKKLIDQLHDLHIGISYDRVIQLEKLISHSMCHQFLSDNIVCPSHLLRGIGVSGALDNIDRQVQSGPSSKAIFGRLACLLSRIYRHQENGAGRRKTIPGSQYG